jgi:hypothetical protein
MGSLLNDHTKETKWESPTAKDIMKNLEGEVERIAKSTGFYGDPTWIVANTTKSIKKLKELANETCNATRICVAANFITPPEILISLATDDCFGVRREVERNPNATREVIQTVRAYEFYKENSEL